MTLQITKLSGALGAEISGINLCGPLSEPVFSEVEQALLDHQVLFFRDQPISPADQVALARRFGEIDIHPFGRHLDAHPEVGLLDQTNPKRDGANRWHTDSTFMPRPPKVAILRAVQLPETGGDTSWASMHSAFEALSPALQKTFSELTASHDVSGPLRRAIAGGHSVGSLQEVQAAWPLRSHPLVCTHPETGRPMLYANSNFTTRIDGLSDAESEMLLRFLFDWVRSPEFQVRFRWEPDSVALWDNRCTQHFAAADYTERRIMHRVTVAGDWQPSYTAS